MGMGPHLMDWLMLLLGEARPESVWAMAYGVSDESCQATHLAPEHLFALSGGLVVDALPPPVRIGLPGVPPQDESTRRAVGDVVVRRAPVLDQPERRPVPRRPVLGVEASWCQRAGCLRGPPSRKPRWARDARNAARNHAHFGGAGKYTRVIARHDCFGFCVSGHTTHPPKLSEPNWNPMGNPPMSFAFPSGQEAPLHLDMGSSWFEPEHFPQLYQRAPAAFFKSMGLVGVTNFLAGIMAGMMDPALEREHRQYEHAGYGTFVLAVDISRFVPVADFVAESDRTMRALHELPPLPGCERYDLPGGPEWEREKEYRTHGIPVGSEHQAELEGICAELGVDVPWAV